MRRVTRYGGLLLATTAAGSLSGIFWFLPIGVMGGALALCLSLGTICLEEEHDRRKQPPSRRYAMLCGAIVGLAGGVCMLLLQTWLYPVVAARGRGHENFLKAPEFPVWVLLLEGVMYGVILHLICNERRRGRETARQILWRCCWVCWISKAIGLWLFAFLSELPFHEPMVRLLFSLVIVCCFYAALGTGLFVALWTSLTLKLAPRLSAGAASSPPPPLPVSLNG